MTGFWLTALAALLTTAAEAESARWIFPDAPYRAVVKLQKAPEEPTAGIAISLPEFGNTTEKLLDVVMTDGAGELQPLAPVWRGSGQEVLLLAKEMRVDQEYYVYFGGARFRQGPAWQPQLSLLMETRPLAQAKALDSWEKMDAAWRAATEVDGASWVPSIFHGGNPFSNNRRFLTRYTGYLRTPNLAKLTLYTLSSDASFVVVNGKYEFGWPAEHGAEANAKTAPATAVSCAGPLTRIEYYHAKTAGGRPAMVLGWKKGAEMETIPASAWVQPGTTKLVRLEQVSGGPVPAPVLKLASYLGYADLWLYEVTGTLATEVPAGWTVEWKFADGARRTQREFTRIMVGGESLAATVKVRRGDEELTGVRQVNFVDPVPAASVRDGRDMNRYLTAMAAENLEELPVGQVRGYVAFLLAVEQWGAVPPFAAAWLKRDPDPADPLWLPAQLSRLRGLAQTDARQAVEELRRIAPAARKKYAAALDLLELDLLVFHLNDPAAVTLAQHISQWEPKSVPARLALVRTGDFYRLQGRFKEAAEQYQQAQARVVEAAAGRQLPAQDRAYSITINNLLERGDVDVAEEKVTEWEARHPVAKLETDFLILRARVLMALGRWREALVELESFAKLQAESPFQIDAAFYRARALFELGRKEEARAIWRMIVEKYPAHALVAKSRQWAEKS